MLYLIANEDRTLFKLGTSRSPQKRLKQLQTAHPGKLELLATFRGTHADETKFHAWLSPDRVSGEWFRFSPKIEQILKAWNTRSLVNDC